MTHCIIEGCEKQQVTRRGWCSMHNARWQRHGDPLFTKRPGLKTQHGVDQETRFWSRVDASGVCMEWTGGLSGGYGRFDHERAHRWAYVNLVGPIPDGLVLDHLCRNKRCVDPDHLEPVPPRVNILRGSAPPAINARRTSCINGHSLEGGGVREYVRPDTGKMMRVCRKC